MFLATTALSEFWDKNRELLFLGPWCTLYERREEWAGLRGRTMGSPWDARGAIDRGAEDISALHEALLGFLAAFLDEAHGVRHGERYWRILLGPWLLGYTSAIVDHALHLDRAFAEEPGLETRTLDPRDALTPRDTADFALLLKTDRFHLQLYSEILASRGLAGRPQRGPAGASPAASAPGGKTALKAALARIIRAWTGPERVFADFYASPGQSFALLRAASLAPLGGVVPAPRAPVDAERRAPLAGFRSPLPFAPEAAALLARHLPTLFLEGHAEFRRSVLKRWPVLPRFLLTSVGWYSNETFKLLAAEATENGAELVISQHGGGYGMMDPLFSERHERRISDRYLTWGWTDGHYPGAKLVPLPTPRLDFRPRRAKRRAGKWLLISTTLFRYPYSIYFAMAPAGHRFGEQIEDRARFLRAVRGKDLEGLRLRLHDADFEWGHRARLVEEFPGLAFDVQAAPWTARTDDFDLIVIDHPQTSILESLARDKPTLLFWNPALWRMRPEASGVLEGLRRARILFGSPEEAARELPAALADPAAWWSRPEARSARAAFCERYARSSPDWLMDWKEALREE